MPSSEQAAGYRVIGKGAHCPIPPLVMALMALAIVMATIATTAMGDVATGFHGRMQVKNGSVCSCMRKLIAKYLACHPASCICKFRKVLHPVLPLDTACCKCCTAMEPATHHLIHNSGTRVKVSEDGDLELHPPLGGTIFVNHTDLLVTLATLREELDLVKQENKVTRLELALITAQLSNTTQALAAFTGMQFANETGMRDPDQNRRGRQYCVPILFCMVCDDTLHMGCLPANNHKQ